MRRLIGSQRPCVQVQVQDAHVQLAKHAHASLVLHGCLQRLQHLPWQWFAGLVMAGNAVDNPVGLVQPVLHELRREFHGVPFAGDACKRGLRLRGEHVLQCVAELMEERVELVKAEQCGRAAVRWAHACHDGRDWLHAPDAVVAHDPRHPSSGALLLRPREEVQVEVARRRLVAARTVDLEQLHVLVPRGARRGGHMGSKHFLGQVEEACQAAVEREVGAEHLSIDAEKLLHLLVAPVGSVPMFQGARVVVTLCKLLQVGKIPLRLWVGDRPQLLQQLLGLRQCCHLPLHGELRIVVEAKELSLALAELENAAEHTRVVRCEEFRGLLQGGNVDLLAETGVLRVCEHGPDGGRVQRQQVRAQPVLEDGAVERGVSPLFPSPLTLLVRRLPCKCNGSLRKALELLC
mmetsp:Transcript_29667/g.84874  ORF Transcript_29667/g.84874 Transcript_29667/m.84874 type:complete len:405 (+) Transcript_29667:574-1788(+)